MIFDPEPKKITVIIPCHNEAESIATVIGKFPREKMARLGMELDILVVDNNSNDGTAAIAEKAGARVLHESRKGKGFAMRTAFWNLPDDTDYVVMLDGDDTYSPEEVLRIIEPLRTDFCDVVIGSRLEGKIQLKAMNRLNRIGNRLFTTAVRWLYGANVTDVLTGYFAWKKPALDELRPHVTSGGFAIEMEMITKMARLGHEMAAVPISYHPRAGASNLRPFKDGIRILNMLLRNLLWRPAQAAVQAGSFTPRHIAFVSDAIYPYMKGGKEKRLHEITKRLAAMGHDVHIYTMHWWDGPEKVRIEDGVHLHALCNYHDMYSGDRRTIKEALIFSLACFKLMRAKFDVLDVDHMPFFPLFTSWLVCTLRGRKLYATWHEALSRQEWVNYMGAGGVIAAGVERITTKLPYCITAASAHTQELLQSVHGRNKRVQLVASGVDTSLLRQVESKQTACDVLYVGRLVKDKNVDKLIEAMAIVAKDVPDIHCIILGEGLERQRLEKLSATLKLEHNITFLGTLPEASDVYSYMKAAKVFCSPSVREGFGIVTLESLGCGTPVITVDAPANAARHLIEDGKNGSVVPLEPAAIAGAIRRWTSVAQKPDTANNITEWDWHQLAQKQAEVYMS